MSFKQPHYQAKIARLSIAILCVLTCLSQAELQLHPLFTDHAILQQGQAVPVWGSADAGEKVRIRFGGQTKTSTTQADGKWVILLDPLSASAEPRTLSVSAGSKSLVIKDLLVGEVWLCAGQSNMARSMGGMVDKKDIIEDARAGKFETIRLFKVPLSGKNQAQSSIKASWAKCTKETVNGFSGTGFYFGHTLHRDLKVPVGLIHANWGGTNASCWISKDTLENDPAAADLLRGFKGSLARYPEAKKIYDIALAEWTQKVKAAELAGKSLTDIEPREPMGLEHPKQPAGFYNGMIAPLQPYAVAGVVWSQGESNATTAPKAAAYRNLMLALISGWRADWAKKTPGDQRRDFPFYQVQLPNFAGGDPDGWPIIREQMLQIWQQGKNTGMVVTIDVGNPDDIHPQNKRIVGDRLARFARANTYRKNIVYSGPIYKSMQMKGKALVLEFDHVGSGLSNKDSKALRHFTIAGEDEKFVNAEARIDGKGSVIVSSPKVKNPQAVRYAWSNNPENPNFSNKEGLPASPFRTDDWKTFDKKQ